MRTLIAVALLTLPGCATIQMDHAIEIMTDPPGAAISVNGAYIGDSPVIANIPTQCLWVGVGNSPDGYDCQMVRIQAEPKSTMKGKLYARSAIVTPNRMASNKILMNLTLEPVEPTRPIEMR